MKLSYIILFGLLSISTLASAQQPTGTWRHFINTTTPRAMVADGPYLWVATDAGLVKFDRRIDTIVAFYTTDNSAIPANDVWKLAVDKNDTLWVSTRSGGLAKFKNGNWTVFNYKNSPLPGSDGGILAVDSLDRLWVATVNGLLKLDKGVWTKYDSTGTPMADNRIECLAADQKGNIWIGCAYQLTPISRGFILKFDGSSKWEVHNDTLDGFWLYDTTYDTVNKRQKIDTTLAHELDPDNPWCMTVDHTGALWIGFESLINRQVTGGWGQYDDIATYNVTYDLEEDRSGNMWGADAYGAFQVDSMLHQLQWHRGKKGFPFYGANAIIPIGDSLWVCGNGGGGIAYGKDTTWTIYNKFSDCPFENDEVYAMTVDSKGRDWFGMRYYHMLYMYDGATWTIYDSLVHGSTGVLALCADSSGNVYVGSGGGGITKFDGHTATLIDLHEVDSFSNVIYSLMWDERRHALWVGNGWEGSTGMYSGVAEFDGKSWKTWAYPDISAQITALTLDIANNVWATCYDIAGIYELMSGSDTWQHSTALNASYTNTLSADAKGGLWAVTENGPEHWDGTNWTLVTDAKIIAYPAAGAIDSRGNVWLGGSGSGASAFDGNSWTAFSTSNSNIGTETIWTAMADRSGNVWFGTNGQGLLEFVPDAPAIVTSLDPIRTELTIYPNPTTGILHIESTSNNIVITDLLGRTRMRAVAGDGAIDVSGLPQGVYSISDGKSHTQFVKE